MCYCSRWSTYCAKARQEVSLPSGRVSEHTSKHIKKKKSTIGQWACAHVEPTEPKDCVYISGRERSTQGQYVQHKPPRGQTARYQLEQEVKISRWSLLVFLWCRSQLDNVCACVRVCFHMCVHVCVHMLRWRPVYQFFFPPENWILKQILRSAGWSASLCQVSSPRRMKVSWRLRNGTSPKATTSQPLPVSWETDF